MWMFGLAAICWVTWKIHNRIRFEKIPPRNVLEVTFSAITFMRYWVGMQLEDTQKMISLGINLMVSMIMKVMRRRSDSTVPLTIRGMDQEDDEEEENSVVRMEEEP
jgi:hypothetical protein